MVAVTMQVMGVPTITMATYLGIILLFFVSALYVGMRFDPLTADEIQAKVDKVNRDD